MGVKEHTNFISDYTYRVTQEILSWTFKLMGLDDERKVNMVKSLKEERKKSGILKK